MDAKTADQLPSGLVELDSSERIVLVNSVLADWIGVAPSGLVGRSLSDVLVPESADAAEPLPDLWRLLCADGSRRPVFAAFGSPTVDGGRCITVFDASEQQASREALRERHTLASRTQNRLELVISASIAFADSTTERELADVLVATTARAYSAEEAVVFLLDDDMLFRQVAGTNPFVDLADSDALARRAIDLHSVLKISGVDEAYATADAIGAAFEAAGVQSMIIAPIRQRDEALGILAAFFHHPRTFDEQASPLADALAGQAARAISGLRLQHQLEHAALHDDTTGLPNRRLLEEWMDAPARAANAVLAVLFVDLDGFKGVNDRLGHHVGDTLLRQVASRLQGAVRDGDVVVRYGGDEFVIICEVATGDGATEMAERIRQVVREPYPILPDGITIGASVGVSVRTEPEPTEIDRLVRLADQAMYRAKYAGGDRVASALS